MGKSDRDFENGFDLIGCAAAVVAFVLIATVLFIGGGLYIILAVLRHFGIV